MKTLSDLAASLGVTAKTLESLGFKREGEVWLNPERDADGAIIGWARRFDDGRKGFVAGGKRGLALAWPIEPYAGTSPDDPILIVEGVSDAAAGTDLGFTTIGRPSATGGAELLRPLVKGRHVAIIAENDAKPGGDWPGKRGAETIAAKIAGDAASVRIVFPFPNDLKDLRAWKNLGKLDRGTLLAAIRGAKEFEATPADWPELIPFGAASLPAFPTHALPGVLRDWVEAESRATQTPADLAAMLALAVCAACIARRVVVEPRSGWREPSNLFVAVLLEPGNRKSAVFTDATKPLRELEAERIEAERPAVARAQCERRQRDARLRSLEKIAAEKGDAEARREAGELAVKMAEESEPVLPRLIVDDATAEKLGMMLAEQGGRIASMSPEGGVFDLMAGLYSKSGTPQFGIYLMGHSGDDLVTDRVGRAGVRAERPALTCAYAIQPAVMEGLAGNPAFRGRGLLARFLYAAPLSWIGHREIAPEPVSNLTREAYRLAVRALAEIDGEIVLGLTAEADAVLRDWEAQIEVMLADGGDMECIRDWGAKLAGATLRLACVMHCVEHGAGGRIDDATLVAAVEIARYLIPHAEAALNLMNAHDGAEVGDAQYLLAWIERHERRTFTKSEAQHHGKRRFPKADDIDPALAELARRGYIRQTPAEATAPGRPPSPAYGVNPASFVASNPEKRSRYSHNSPANTPNGDCGNNGSAPGQFEDAGRARVAL